MLHSNIIRYSMSDYKFLRSIMLLTDKMKQFVNRFMKSHNCTAKRNDVDRSNDNRDGMWIGSNFIDRELSTVF